MRAMTAWLATVRRRWLEVVGVVLAVLGLMATAGIPARADLLDQLAGPKPVICTDQTYALCAGASCFVFNDVAYCTCDVRHGNSISSPFNYGNGNICSLNAAGVGNGYMASTFSLPESLKAPFGHQALYRCPRSSRADYARCDGGICFTSTSGNAFPGSRRPLGDQQIVCSCPVTRADSIRGLEIIGPYPCEKAFFRNCERAVANSRNGATLYDGTAIGSTVTAIRLLDGSVPLLNTCR